MADRSRAAVGKVAIFVLSALLTQPSYAQQFPETDRQKAQEDREKAQEARKKADREDSPLKLSISVRLSASGQLNLKRVRKCQRKTPRK
jgi:hypothetical protein